MKEIRQGPPITISLLDVSSPAAALRAVGSSPA
jgi:hypothetical protein